MNNLHYLPPTCTPETQKEIESLKKEAKWNALVESFDSLIDYTIVETVPDFTIGNTVVD